MDFFTKIDNKIICDLCAHHCKIKPDQKGICGVIENSNGEFTCKVYGYPSALHVDPIEKKPLYHFLPGSKTLSLGTIGCNFACPFCQNWQLSQAKNIPLKHYYSPQKIVDIALQTQSQSISYTYNEPTIFYLYAKNIAKLAQRHALKNIMVTNGFMSHKVCLDMTHFIDAVNVDIKSFDKSYYKKKLKGDLDVVLSNTQLLKKNGLHVEVTTLMIPSIDKEQILKIASFIASKLGTDTPWHISAYHPDFKMIEGHRTPIDSLHQAYDIAQQYGLQNIYLGNV